MAYEDICMYCFKPLDGESVCPHCGRDAHAAVPQIQLLPGTTVHGGRYLVGRALGQDATGIVYAAKDTKRETTLRLREYLPRDCAERLSDGTVVPMSGLEDQFDRGLNKLRASVESVKDPKQRHFFFEENGTAYIAQRKGASSARGRDEDDEESGGRRVGAIVGIAAAVVVAVVVAIIVLVNGILKPNTDVTLNPTIASDASWAPALTPTPTPYTSPTFAALVDPEQSWLDYTYSGNVEAEYQKQQQSVRATAVPTIAPATTKLSSDTETLQRRLAAMGWLSTEAITGKYDAATKQAVKDFQTFINENYNPAEKLAVDGKAGQKTLLWVYGIDAVKPTPSPTPLVTEDPEQELTVDKNSSKQDIRAVQRKLIFLGLMKAGSDDGVYGTSTISAVKQFQQRANLLSGNVVLEITGTVDPLTMAYLNYYVDQWEQILAQQTADPTAAVTPAPTPTAIPTEAPEEREEITIDPSSPKESIQAVQQMLIDLKMLKGKADGVFGKGTTAAVKKFQEYVNEQQNSQVLTVDGKVDTLTLNFLEYYAELIAVETEAPTQEPTATPTVAPTEATPIDSHSSKKDIRHVQDCLIAVGLLKEGSADGDYGKETQNAVKQFQTFINGQQGEHTVEISGVCDPTTLNFLELYAEKGIKVVEATEAPTESPAPSVGSVTNMTLTINGSVYTDKVATLTGKEVEFKWSAEGDVESYYLYVDDAEGKSVYAYEAIHYTEGNMNLTDLVEDTVYTIRVGALPVNGEEADIVWTQAQFSVQIGSVTEAPTQMPDAVLVAIKINGALAGSSVIEVSGETVGFEWASTGDVESYTARITDAGGEVIAEVKDSASTTGGVPIANLTPGEIYTLTVGARPTGGSDEQIVWTEARFTAPAASTENPTETPTEAPTEAPAAQVGAPRIAINGTQTGSDPVEVTSDSVMFNWLAEGDCAGYSVRIIDIDENVILSLDDVDMTEGILSKSDLTAGMIYSISIGARPKGGSDEEIVWTTARFVLPTPPTEAPTPEATVAAVSKPQINIDGSAYSRDGILYLGGDAAIFTWTAEGDVIGYRAYVADTDGRRMDLGTIGTSFTLDLTQLSPGMYQIDVGAIPAGAKSENDIQWNALNFGIAGAEPTPTAEAVSWPTKLDYNSAAEDIQKVQMKLYELGILSTDGLQAGVLDTPTLQSIIAFQQRVNELFPEAQLVIIDPTQPEFAVDEITLGYLFAATPEMFTVTE